MKLGIAGYGIVGKATHKGLLSNCAVVIHDPIFNTTIEDLYVCNYVFFCIPTDTESSIQLLVDEIKRLKAVSPSCTVIIRSTVPVGTCSTIEKLINDKIYYMPEFLRERVWETDCFNRPIIVGSDDQPLPICLYDEDCIVCSLEEAEEIYNEIALSEVKQTVDKMVADGIMEIVGYNDDNEPLFGLTELGKQIQKELEK